MNIEFPGHYIVFNPKANHTGFCIVGDDLADLVQKAIDYLNCTKKIN